MLAMVFPVTQRENSTSQMEIDHIPHKVKMRDFLPSTHLNKYALRIFGIDCNNTKHSQTIVCKDNICVVALASMDHVRNTPTRARKNSSGECLFQKNP